MQAPRTRSAAGAVLTIAIVGLTLTTAYIHFTLGGLLFLLNAAGYAGLAGLYVIAATVDHSLVRRFDWLPRIGLAGYTAATIAGYLVMGPYFALGWITKGIEVVLIGLVVVDVVRVHGGPIGLVRAAARSI